MGVQKFLIEVLHNPVLSYYPGETISGIVRVISADDLKLEGVKITFTGKASAEWLEPDQTKYGRTHFVEEVIFCWQEYIFGSGNSREVLPPGDHEFPFEFKLPKGLPTSFVNKESKVRYDIEAVIERGWKPRIKARVPFTINGSLDLNKISGIAEHVGFRVSRNLSCFFCTKGLVGFEVSIAKQGYVCGEYVQFVAELFNQSKKKVKGFTACLMQKAIYRVHAHDRGTTFTRVVCSAQGPSVEPGETEIWRGDLLRIPPLPPSHLATCFLRVVDVLYTLKMEMILPGFTNNLTYEFPITIGTVPVRTKTESLAFSRDRFGLGRQSVQFATPLASWQDKSGSTAEHTEATTTEETSLQERRASSGSDNPSLVREGSSPSSHSSTSIYSDSYGRELRYITIMNPAPTSPTTATTAPLSPREGHSESGAQRQDESHQ